MNKQMILGWLLNEAADKEKRFKRGIDLEQTLSDLNRNRPVTLPDPLPRVEKKMIAALRKQLRDNVTLISLILHQQFPDRYLFYRVSKLEPEIFAGFDFLAEIEPTLNLPFDRVRKTGFWKYMELNTRLLAFARQQWPDVRDPQPLLHAFLYHGLGTLFLEPREYKRYWIVVADGADNTVYDPGDIETWSGRKEMRTGDLVFLYRTAPKKAITDLFEIADAGVNMGSTAEKQSRWAQGVGALWQRLAPSAVGQPAGLDPWGRWDGFWVGLRHIRSLDDISFATLRSDSVLGEWGTIRKQFQGVVANPMSPRVYNRLLDLMSGETVAALHLERESVQATGLSGRFASEAEFEDEVIAPLLKQWQVDVVRQAPCEFQFGSQRHRGRVDFLLRDAAGLLTLFENKLRITDDIHLADAIAQAKSYALMLGLSSFVIAAPEGLWLYKLDRNSTELAMHVDGAAVDDRQQEVRNKLRELRG